MSATSNTVSRTAGVTGNHEAARFWSMLALLIIAMVVVCALAAWAGVADLPEQASLVGP